MSDDHVDDDWLVQALREEAAELERREAVISPHLNDDDFLAAIETRMALDQPASLRPQPGLPPGRGGTGPARPGTRALPVAR